MPKSSQTSSKEKSSSKTEAKPKNMKPKPRKIAKSSSELAPTIAPSPLISSIIHVPSSHIPVVHTIPTSTGPSLPKPPAHAHVSASKNTSKSTKIKATPRKSVKSDNVVIDVTAKVDTIVKETVVQGESVSTIISRVKLTPSKLDVLVSSIDVAPLDMFPPTSDKPRVEEPTIETNIATQEKRIETTNVMPMVEEEGDKEPLNKEASDGEEEGRVVAIHEEHQAQYMANDTDEKKSENKGESGEQKESEAEEKLDERVGDYGEEKKDSGEEGDSESEGSIAIGNTVITPSKEVSGEKRTEETGPFLTPFTGDEEVSSDEDNLPMSAEGKKSKKAPLQTTKSVIPARKEVDPPSRTPLTRSKIKVVDEQIIKESRGAKNPRKQYLIVEPVVELDAKDESDSTLQEKTSAQKRKAVKSTKAATLSKWASKGKKRKGMPLVVDKLTEFKNRKVLNGKILANTNEKGMAQLVEKLELQGWRHMFVKAFPLVCVPDVVKFYVNFQFDEKVVKSNIRGLEMEFDIEELGMFLNIPSLGFDNYLKKKWPAIDNDVDTEIVVTRKFS
ncbi:uncharacterized protein [Nicotiana tomentosiformis]|uniref:uncharacterized protein n=1 Tax=Nicotiana tomentosiformis TaxID=4098 RepID=UPI00051C32E5|nr:neurofilament medium polypeptide-like [Nicotiana tomentosiformis]